MAFYIEMDKVVETEEYVEYTFGRNLEVGIIRLGKKDETIHVLKECPLDVNGEWSKRAAMKLIRLSRGGSFPGKTQWAS
ncbi:hypothetical protein ACVK1X_005132 [Pseudomonas sp. PvR086]|jgi:hypothetical protein|uniref:hypothetical protein n=1 Tax=Pseudomonas TaxID=286 RepID=UPI000B353931|nr:MULTISPECIES: hypothetical protein [Pseudomonas]PMY89749.1 hypothetical protein C1X67_27520 [Pseudomonas sp. FW305-62]PNA38750.1 hypothetical protein C1X71_28575 [Pseudomonas sp. FW306-2-2C-A10BC]MBD9608192.1 hypothetical protein [Pseudomonas sp. PDM08]MDR7109774.1 hypothetical protein [Pseudomonas frederiksbergensis]PMY56995.1 hypothetical protein C1X70_01215 [Pseudomonas sp. FW305-53]